jgi:putative selenate reductase molybdopterin-binding subunit
VKSYYTNLSPAGAYQGYGAPKGSFALQTALAELAAELGMDQLELIEKNRVRSGSRIEILRSLGEGRPGAPVTLGECGLGDMIKRARPLPGTNPSPSRRCGLTRRLEDRPRRRDHSAGLGPAGPGRRQRRDQAPGRRHPAHALGRRRPGHGPGHGNGQGGRRDPGPGHGRRGRHIGGHRHNPFDKGAYASSGTYFSGNAAVRAAEDLRDKCLKVASGILGEPVEDLKLVHRGLIKGKRGEITLAKLAHMAIQGEGHHELSGFGNFKTDHAAFPYGAHFAKPR